MICVCPSCGATHHVRPLPGYQDPAVWLAKVAPDTKPGEAPRVLCLDCWKRANAGPKSN